MNMNFGHKILLTFIAFALLMGTLVYMSLQTEFELVSKDYYKEELAYQDVIDATDNAKSLETSVSIRQEHDSIILHMPEEMKGLDLIGDVYFYCAADSKRDRKIALQADKEGLQRFAVGKDVQPAAYRVRVNWNAEGKQFYNDSFLQVQ
ncbi:hypothetical protein HY58_11595 [Flavihumibacter sp. ZG627]|nr:hypothetical protein HY58_11595 [Flavihumibacter sp. ZG627]